MTPVFFLSIKEVVLLQVQLSVTVHRDLSTTGSCTLPPSGSAAMFQTKLSSSPPALGEIEYSVFQWHSLGILCSGPPLENGVSVFQS